ncbi:MAG: hypothetical protein EOP11_05185 [Proteobacteria bacterium]|nr:MAG: hypothetical protein EOP11_05185 [Pseudomonadota bacterium]
MVILKSLPLLLVLGLFTSCTSTGRMLLTTDLPRTQTNYKKLPVFFQEPPRKTRPLALIAVARDGENATWAVEMLKMEAANIGADALAHVEINYSTGLFPTLRAQGLAVKYAD